MGRNDHRRVDHRKEPHLSPQPSLRVFSRILLSAVQLLVMLLAFLSRGSSQVRVGADILFDERFDLVRGKRVALVANNTSLLASGEHLADALHRNAETHLTKLFGPEHGIRGDTPDGISVGNSRDDRTGLPVFSLFGAATKPTPEMLDSIDVVLFDIQDVGARFYTYESTLSLTMEAAAERGIPFVVLDRPNPIRGVSPEGFVLVDSLRSFVGLHPIPIVHAMTLGELARMMNGEGWLRNGVKASLTVVALEGWKREMWYDETGLAWVKPSPNMTTLTTAVVYPGSCLVEGTNLSEGRGTSFPFIWIGAPYVDGVRWARALNDYRLPGVRFVPVEFTPRAIPNVASNPKYVGERCHGVELQVSDRNAYRPVATAVYVLASARNLFPSGFQWREKGFDRLAGTPRLREEVSAGELPARIVEGWTDELKKFEEMRKKYLLY